MSTPTSHEVIENEALAEIPAVVDYLDDEWIRTQGGSVAHILAKRLDDHYVITACSRMLDWFRCYDASEGSPECLQCLARSS